MNIKLPVDNKWHYLNILYDGYKSHIYIDGVEVDELS